MSYEIHTRMYAQLTSIHKNDNVEEEAQQHVLRIFVSHCLLSLHSSLVNFK